jgi:hypothetical protein
VGLGIGLRWRIREVVTVSKRQNVDYDESDLEVHPAEGGRRVIFVHRDDVTALGFNPGDVVDVVSKWDDADIVRCAPSFRIVEYDTPRGSAAAYFPETNALCPLDFTALSSNQPAYKSIIISLVPQGTGGTSEGGGQDRVGSDWSHKSDPEPTHLS